MFNTESDNIFIQKDFTYQECKRIYTNFGLGKRLVESLPNFSMSSKLFFLIENAPEEVAHRFKKICDLYNIDRVVKNASILARVYGMAGIVLLTNKDGDNFEPLGASDLAKYDIYFNVLDPLTMKVNISQDPLSKNFMKPSFFKIQDKQVDKSRAFCCFNGQPTYLNFQASNLNFGGQSVFANMRRFIETWIYLFDALEKVSIKAGSFIITNEKDGGGFDDPNDIWVAKKSISLIKRIKSGMVAFLGRGQKVDPFNLSGVESLTSMIQECKLALAMALNDTPVSILLDKELSNGLSEGSEDMKSVVIAVNNFREQTLRPIYNFVFSYLFYKAWNDDFIDTMRAKYPEDFDKLGNSQIRNLWRENFSFKWESVYPKTPDEETKSRSEAIKSALDLKTLGYSDPDIENYLFQNADIDGDIVENVAFDTTEDTEYDDGEE